MSDTFEVLEFTCPRCGSHHFERSETSGCCHGYTDQGACNFRWDVKDDAKYFRGTGRFMARTIRAQAVER